MTIIKFLPKGKSYDNLFQREQPDREHMRFAVGRTAVLRKDKET